MSTGIIDTVRGIAPAFASGNPVAMWHAARQGTQDVAAALPDAPVLTQVKDLVRRYPVVTAAVVLGAAVYLTRRRA